MRADVSEHILVVLHRVLTSCRLLLCDRVSCIRALVEKSVLLAWHRKPCYVSNLFWLELAMFQTICGCYVSNLFFWLELAMFQTICGPLC